MLKKLIALGLKLESILDNLDEEEILQKFKAAAKDEKIKFYKDKTFILNDVDPKAKNKSYNVNNIYTWRCNSHDQDARQNDDEKIDEIIDIFGDEKAK